MTNMNIKNLPADEGMRLVLNMVKAKHLAGLFEVKSKSAGSYISFGVNHTIHNGKPFYYSVQQVANLQSAITLTASQLKETMVTQDDQTREDSPYCYGEDMVSKFKVLGKVIKLPYLFINVLHKTVKWQKMHLSGKTERYYNHFTDDELIMINRGIQTIAQKLSSIQLVYQKGEEYEPSADKNKAKEQMVQNWNDEYFTLLYGKFLGGDLID